MIDLSLPAVAGSLYRFDFWGETIRTLGRRVAGLVPADDGEAAAAQLVARRTQLEAMITAAEGQERIIYLLEVPAVRQRIEYDHAVMCEAHRPSDAELAELAREEARRIFGDPSPELDLAGDVADAGGARGGDDAKRFNALLARLRTRSPEVNRALAARERAEAIGDFLAVQFFLRGSEGSPITIERDARGVTDECMSLIQDDIKLIAGKIRMLMRLSGLARKNLLSPLSSESSTANSMAA